MVRTIYTPSSIDETTEKRLWETATIVFDTSALLDFYYMTKDNQDIISDILTSMNERIWIPAHVYYEFCKNRKNVIAKPIHERYNDKDLQSNKLIETLLSYISQWEKPYYHPYIEDKNLAKIRDIVNDIKPKISEAKTIVAEEYQKRRREIKAIANNDNLCKAVDGFAKGEPFSFSEIKDIVIEGACRYANQIPPGYKDAETKNGINQYGDLIIWKEIIRYARDNNRDIIYISNDVKPDWLVVNETNGKDFDNPQKQELGNPRRELLAEFEEETEQEMWMYQTADFIGKITLIYKPKQPILELGGKLGVIRDVLLRLSTERNLHRNYEGDTMLVRCGTCGELFEVYPNDFNLEWNLCGGDACEVGTGIEYESNESIECPNCERQMDLTLQVWEYPIGIFNSQNIEIDGGNIENVIDLSKYICFDDFETCVRCGERAVLNDAGLCDECEAEYSSFINSDD